jgi:hypothetical protein
MKVMTSKPEFDITYGTECIDWDSLGAAKIVDVGGAQGHFAMGLAQRYKDLHIVVQDMAEVIRGANAGELAHRVQFMPHNLFSSQTIFADVFFFRWVFHNWSDQHCVQIIKAQSPALRPGARMIIQEVFMPETGTVSHWKESDSRYSLYVTNFHPVLTNFVMIEQWILRWHIHSTLEKELWQIGKP